MPQVVCLGEVLIDLFAGTGVALQEANALYPSPGGAPANVAVALSRLGVDVGFIGKVGADDFGSFLIQRLAGEGVDVTYLTADQRRPTALAVVVAQSPSSQHFWVYNGADALLCPDELDRSYVQSASVFVYGSVTLAHGSRNAALQAAWWAREAGRQVVFDVNLRPAVWSGLDAARQGIVQGIASASVAKLNEAELEFVTGFSEVDVGSQKPIEQGLQLCCVSLGARGAYFNNGLAAGRVPAFDVAVVDTTGCGDAFVAGLVSGLLQQHAPVGSLAEDDLRDILRFANACGALAATRTGAMTALPTRAAVEELLQEGGSLLTTFIV